jgi:hypothetical protein
MRQRSLVVLVLLLCSLPAEADSLRRLSRDFGLRLVDGGGKEAWTQQEAQRLLSFFERLPRSLRELPRKTAPRYVNVYKNASGEPFVGEHATLPLLAWQLVVRADSEQLERAFIHQLLHMYEVFHRGSDAEDWLALSGWRARSYFGVDLKLLPRRADNQDVRAYASEEGLASPEEDFVTFGEAYFAGDESGGVDSLACLTREKFRYFTRLFPDYTHPLASHDCPTSAAGLLDDLVFLDPVTGGPIDMGRVTPETVEGFELLYATPGVQDAAEIAGHLVLRVRLRNNPKAARLGIENPHDLVISFLADTEAGSGEAAGEGADACDARDSLGGDPLAAVIQPLKGLSGGFLTVFDRQTLEQTVKSYTIRQDRNLLRYELLLSEEQEARLIERLYAAKRNYRTPYYFFDRNCASVLVQVIGEGLGATEVAEFDPLVVPPNALVALLIRKGLARPVHPAFYSFRKKAHIAQEMLRGELAALTRVAPQRPWPDLSQLTSPSQYQRTRAYRRFVEIAATEPALRAETYRVASLGQEAELAFRDPDNRCEDQTSEATSILRRFQRDVRVQDMAAAQRGVVDVNEAVLQSYAPLAQEGSGTGSPHTHLMPLSIGAGSGGAVVLGAALHEQEMGSISTQSMQRATSVSLGKGRVALARRRPAAWRLTGLQLRKFKERLDVVPPFHAQEGSFGLGLTVLDATSDAATDDAPLVELGRGELLFNLVASRWHDRFLYAGVGAALMYHKTRPYLALPVRLEGLWSVDAQRAWQLRGAVEYRASLRSPEMLATASLVRRLAMPAGTELLAKVSAERHRFVGDSTSYLLGIEWIRW